MLESFRRWVGGTPNAADWSQVTDWAARHGAQFKRAREDLGFVVEGELDARAWRLEWGPPQRAYIDGHELRLRMELGLPQELQMLLLSLPLMETLERQTFERYTEQMQTHIDLGTPEEMRWLAVFQKVPLAGKDLRGRFGAVAMAPKIGAAWLAGALGECLAECSATALANDPPLLLMTLRGRVYLRLQLAEPDPAALDAMLRLFGVAAAQAVRVAGGAGEGPGAWPSTASTAWQTQLQEEDRKRS